MMRRLLFVSGLTMLAACLDSRERLVPPEVTLSLVEQTVAAGGEIYGTITASDASGIIYVAVQVRSATDTLDRSVAQPAEPATVQYTFSLSVRSGIPTGTPLYVTAIVIDAQNFKVEKEDTITVR
jgi:hypothetical protein